MFDFCPPPSAAGRLHLFASRARFAARVLTFSFLIAFQPQCPQAVHVLDRCRVARLNASLIYASHQLFRSNTVSES
jgi:hypothetical protein